MIKRTHLAIGIFFILFLLSHVTYKLVFVVVALIASILPDIDSAYSSLGSYKIFRPLQFLTEHRGIFHSMTLCSAVSVLLAFYLPVLALPFFLGYSIHLFADSFTLEGINVFWPFETELRGKLKTGGAAEDAIFFIFLVIDIVMFVGLFF